MNQNQISVIARSNQSLIGLKELKYFQIPTKMYLNEEINKIIKDSFISERIKTILNIEFFESISIQNEPIYTGEYSIQDCSYFFYFLLQNIQFNLRNDQSIRKIMNECTELLIYFRENLS